MLDWASSPTSTPSPGIDWATSIPLLTGIVVATVTGFWLIINRRGGERTVQNRQLPPTWPEMWARLDKLEKLVDAQEKKMFARDRAFGNILTAAAEQWPSTHTGPVFNPADLVVLGDTMPSKWARGSSRGPGDTPVIP